MRPNFIHHLHPPSIPAAQARWRYTLGAGGIGIYLVLVLIITGALEMYYYVPIPAEAGLSVQAISYDVPFGWLLRNLHFWAAQLLLIVSGIHLLRIIFTGAYAPPRRLNYLLGLGLFVLVILLDFTGYILRWDTGIQWALVAGTNLIKSIPWAGKWLYAVFIGGSQPGAATLIRFYAWHLFGLMLPAGILIAWHAFRVRRDGGIALPPPAQRSNRERISRFELVRRELVAMLLTSVTLILLALLSPAPIAPVIKDISAFTSEGRAPWFFLWVQQMLKWGDPFLWGVFVPLLVLIVLILLPFIFPLSAGCELGRWFPRSNRLAQIVFALLTILIILLTVLALIPMG
jgi:quinol-cytochrome oxidoreductase complex cytochrome b subunit